jgi:GH15 family glucan-1,4-alpha-glucosidase
MRRFIEDFALIGDLHTAGLVSGDGGLEWLCLPRFDSESVFTALLGDAGCSSWSLSPVKPILASQRRYRGHTLILETTLRSEDGTVRLIDFMPRRDRLPTVVRVVEGVEGKVEMQARIACRFGYGKLPPWTRTTRDGVLMTIGPDALLVQSSTRLEVRPPDVRAGFVVGKEKRATFVLQWYRSHEKPPRRPDPIALLRKTEVDWRAWSARCTYHGTYRDAVLRSLMTLKALIFEPSGGAVAAVTTSLPEVLGGVENFDYRYAWLRDSAFTVNALVDAGYHAEARAWRDWLLRVQGGDPSHLQIMYDVEGNRRLEEWEAEWLPGYEGSRPVHIGNAAYKQFQLGVYGHAMHAIFAAHERAGIKINDDAWAMLRLLLDHICGSWKKPDSGIWEYRGRERHYTTSRVMAWAGLDCGVKLAERDRRDVPDRWVAARDAVHEDVCRRGFSARRGAFVESYEDALLDASVLLVPIVGFLPPEDERVRSTIDAIERELMFDGLIVRDERHVSRDATGARRPTEGAFLACNAWLVENYAMTGRVREARSLFERLLSVANDVGLLAEEYDVRARRLVGNFPQTFSHATLVNAAVRLSRAEPRT